MPFPDGAKAHESLALKRGVVACQQLRGCAELAKCILQVLNHAGTVLQSKEQTHCKTRWALINSNNACVFDYFIDHLSAYRCTSEAHYQI